MLFSPLKHYLDLYITDTALKVSRSLYCFTTSISHGVENHFPRLWGTGISDGILFETALVAYTGNFLQTDYLSNFGVYLPRCLISVCTILGGCQGDGKHHVFP